MSDAGKGIWDCRGKVMTRQQASEFGRQMQEAGKTLVFTNGCFDILHAGHVQSLQNARALGDALIVGLNSDESIRRLKGPSRPIQKQADRAAILAALACVDAVTLFDEDTPYELIQVVRPMVLVKGKDYTDKLVVGQDLVESWGGRVELIDLVPGRSTTGIIDRSANGR